MTIALILAGGTGQRMGENIPKQFIEINGKPVIAYTLEAFERHEQIDRIVVVCVDGWEDYVERTAEKYGISKFERTVTGGGTGQESICNGLFSLEKEYSSEDLVIIHESVRPLITEEIISDCIEKALEHGISMAAIPCPDAMFITEDGKYTEKEYEKKYLRRTQTPHGLRLGKACELHRNAMAAGLTNASCMNALAVRLGETVSLSKGSECNLKLTTQEDIAVLKALLSGRYYLK